MDYLNKKYVIPSIAAAVLVILIAGGFFYIRSRNVPAANNPQAAQNEANKLVAEVGKLIDLPAGENPTVATVTDISKLKDQPFFAKAKNGDKVLIYTNGRRAILYDPVAKKVLDIAPINIGSSSATQAGPKIVLRNGTQTVGLTSKVEGELKQVLPQINVINKENAGKSSYDKTILIVLNPNFKDAANALVNVLKGASIGDLPEGETKPKDGDILIILGKDRT